MTFSPETEKAILCCILLDNECLDICEEYNISDIDFHDTLYQKIFKAMVKLKKEGKIVDTTMVAQILGVEHIPLLYDLSMYIITASGIKDYCEIIKEKSNLRKAQKKAQNILHLVEQEDIEGIEREFIFQLDERVNLVKLEDLIEETEQKKPEVGFRLSLLNAAYQGGWCGGRFIVIGADTSMGKTVVGCHLGMEAALDGLKTFYMTFEMQPSALRKRMICSYGTFNAGRIFNGSLFDNPEHKEEAERFMQKKLEFMTKVGDNLMFNSGNMKFSIVKSEVLRAIKSGCKVIVVDYLQQINNSKGGRTTKEQEIAEISWWLKEQTILYNVDIVSLVQLNKGISSRPDKRPQLSDIRHSGQISQDADICIMLYREERYDPDTDERGVIEYISRKNRNGPLLNIKAKFDGYSLKITDN